MFRILVIEDDRDIQEVLKNYLTAEGYEVVTADAEEDVVVEADGGMDFYGTNTDAWYAHSAMEAYPVQIGDESYTMLIIGTMQAVDQTMKILREILPLIVAVIVCVALVCAIGSSVYLTRPIMSLSRISGKMAALEFDERCREDRTDEVGVLARSLNELSDNLSASLQELKKANQELKTDMEKEREAERKRLAFFAAASHELKTPITILKGHLGGMIQNVGAYREREYYLSRSYEVTENMEGMVKEILDVSRMESGAWEPKRNPVDLAELARLSLAEIIELLEKKNMKLDVRMPEHLNFIGDAPMLEKVFRNLFVNAVRYSPKGAGIHIFMGEYDERLLFYVENSGVRIPEESIPRLFDAFYRVEDSRNRKSGGSGLGLYIVRMVLEQHNGICGAENSMDGVRIWFRLPKNT